MSSKLSKIIDDNNDEVFYWEKRHKTYSGRKRRKLIQFIVDILIFGLPALAGALMIQIQINHNFLVYVVDLAFFIGIIVLFVYHYSNKNITQEE